MDQPMILCPKCGSLSPMGTRQCACGYRLKSSATPYVVAFSLIAALLLFSVAWFSYNLGASSITSANEVEKPVSTVAPTSPPKATPAPTNTPKPTAAPDPLPPNGRIVFPSIKGYPEEGCGLLTIEASNYENYYVKLRDVNTGKVALSFIVHAGMSVDVNVPFGEYVLTYACGDEWYGYGYLFGEDTSYCMAEETFIFKDYGDSVTWWEVELYLQTNGNLETTTIDPDDF